MTRGDKLKKFLDSYGDYVYGKYGEALVDSYKKRDGSCIIIPCNREENPTDEEMTEIALNGLADFLDRYGAWIEVHIDGHTKKLIKLPTFEDDEGRIDVADEVIEDIKKRKGMGKSKYGEYLHTNNGREALQDLYEELLDAAQYIKQALLEKP